MTKLEEKARECASEIKDKYVTLNGLTINDVCKWVEETYIDAATEALRWRDVNVELPDENAKVLCKMKSNNEIVSGYIYFDGKYKIATDPDFHFEDYGEYEVGEWRPVETI